MSIGLDEKKSEKSFPSSERTAGFPGGRRMTRAFAIFSDRHPEIVVAIILWIFSNGFVTTFATFARWQSSAKYSNLGDLCKWDCPWYSLVVDAGYDNAPARGRGDRANWPFFPLFPISAYPLHHWLKIATPGSLVLASKMALLGAIYSFLLLVREPSDKVVDRFKAGALVAFNPYLIYAHAGYTEPLYFALVALAFYFAERQRWILSGLAGGLLSATRLVGSLFVISYALTCLRSGGWRAFWRRFSLDQLVGLLLCPVGAALFALYMHHHTGDALAPLHIQVAWLHTVGNPLRVLWESLAGLSGSPWPRLWGLMTLFALLASIWLLKMRRAELGIYLALAILVPLSATYTSLPRYIWWQPPLLYAIYFKFKNCAPVWILYLAFASAMASFMIVAWFSGNNFVV